MPELGSLVPDRNAEMEFWAKERRVAFIALPGKGGHSGLMPSRLEGAMRSFIVFKEKGVISSWSILGDVSGTLSSLVSTSQGSMLLRSAVFI